MPARSGGLVVIDALDAAPSRCFYRCRRFELEEVDATHPAGDVLDQQEVGPGVHAELAAPGSGEQRTSAEAVAVDQQVVCRELIP